MITIVMRIFPLYRKIFRFIKVKNQIIPFITIIAPGNASSSPLAWFPLSTKVLKKLPFLPLRSWVKPWRT